MRIIEGLDNLPPLRNPVVTVGSFDGIHAGHRELLEHVVRMAAQQHGESVVVTFTPHPRTVLGNRGKSVQLLNTLEEKVYLLAKLGIENLLVLPFTKEFSRIPAEDFLREYLAGKLGLKALVVGYNHRFGYRHAGDFSQLERLQQEFDFSVCEVSRQKVGHNQVSSSVIRHLIAAGNMAQAARLLLHPYMAMLRVDETGRVFAEDPHKLLPPQGDYRVRVEEHGEDGKEGEHILHIGATGSMSLEPSVGSGEKMTVTFF